MGLWDQPLAVEGPGQLRGSQSQRHPSGLLALSSSSCSPATRACAIPGRVAHSLTRALSPVSGPALCLPQALWPSASWAPSCRGFSCPRSLQTCIKAKQNLDYLAILLNWVGEMALPTLLCPSFTASTHYGPPPISCCPHTHDANRLQPANWPGPKRDRQAGPADAKQAHLHYPRCFPCHTLLCMPNLARCPCVSAASGDPSCGECCRRRRGCFHPSSGVLGGGGHGRELCWGNSLQSVKGAQFPGETQLHGNLFPRPALTTQREAEGRGWSKPCSFSKLPRPCCSEGALRIGSPLAPGAFKVC